MSTTQRRSAQPLVQSQGLSASRRSRSRSNEKLKPSSSSSRKKRQAESKPIVDIGLLDRLLSIDLGVSGDEPLSEDLSLERVDRILMRRSALKKFEAAATPEADKYSITKFLERNEACRTWQFRAESDLEAIIDGEMRSILHQCLFPSFDSSFGLAQISTGFQVGPGASVGCEEKDFLTKVFHSDLACTHPDLYTFYRAALGDGTWATAERKRLLQYSLSLVRGSRLSTVPKKVDETRVICTEPPLNMLFQKGIGAILEGCLRAFFGIDIRKQPDINRRLALLGSMYGKYCTIDLVGASDSNARRLCSHALPPLVHWWLELSRSPRTILPDGTEVELHMISSMGNAFTFPLQTMIFASIVMACYRALGLPTPRCDATKPTYGVFGDDIVCLDEAYGVVTKALNRYGFVVNDDKSFSSGSFRESCGGDYWKGHFVRGVYIRKLSSQADLYSTLNRLVRWCVRTGVNLELTLWYLGSRFRRKILTVPFQIGDTGGLKIPWSLHVPQCSDSFTRQTLFKSLEAKARTYKAPLGPGPWKASKDGHHRLYNGDGVLVALCGGYIRDGRVALPLEDSTSFIVRWQSVPFWDFVSKAASEEMRGADWKVRSAQFLTELVRV